MKNNIYEIKSGKPLKKSQKNYQTDLPNIDTITGWTFLVSVSDKTIETVSTDPRLVPTHSVGTRVDGSIWRKKKS